MLGRIIDSAKAAKRSQEETLREAMAKAKREVEVLTKVVRFYLRTEWPDSPGAVMAVEMELDSITADLDRARNKVNAIKKKLLTMKGEG
jgi:hypothetical protein